MTVIPADPHTASTGSDDLGQGDTARGARRAWVLVALTTLAFALRLLANVLFQGMEMGPDHEGFYDGVEFEAIAYNLAEHGEYSVHTGRPSSFRAPGFPFAVAAVYALFGTRNYPATRIFFCLIGAALVPVTFLLARDLAGAPAGYVSAALVALDPNLLYYAMHFASEPIHTLLLVGAVWILVGAIRRRHTPSFFLSGVALGLSALARPIAFYFFPFFVVAIAWIWRRHLGRALLASLALGIGTTAPVVPWAVRNWNVHQRVVLFTTNGGSTFWGANNDVVLRDPALHGQWVTTEAMPDQKRLVRALANEADRDQLEWQFGKEWVRTHLDDLPRLLLLKLRALWTPVSATPNRVVNLLLTASFAAMLPFILIGMGLYWRRRPESSTHLIILLTPLVATTVAALVFYGSARFRSCVHPFLIVFAAQALVVSYDALRARLVGTRGDAQAGRIRATRAFRP